MLVINKKRMALKELLDEIKRLKKIHNETSSDWSQHPEYCKLEGIKETVEAVDEYISLHPQVWKQIKEELNGKN